jgi:hypothetical protein
VLIGTSVLYTTCRRPGCGGRKSLVNSQKVDEMFTYVICEY